MFDFNLDGILAGAQWAAATTQLFYGHVEAVVFYATSLLSYYEKLLPMRRPDVLFLFQQQSCSMWPTTTNNYEPAHMGNKIVSSYLHFVQKLVYMACPQS